MRLDPIIALINDEQNLNKIDVLELFVDVFVEKEPESITPEIFQDYLKIQNMKSSGEYSDLSKSILDTIDKQDLEYYDKYIESIEAEGIEFVPFYSDNYPDRLWSIPDPPLCLYVDGDSSALSEGVAVVGTRKAHDHRLKFVREISKKLVEMDKTVVSGLAHGVDKAAHEGALDADGNTVAVLPGDVQTVRPSGNESLADEIRDQGALVGEMSKNKRIHKGRFVERNRLTSGISSAVIIGASGETGGTIHQANFAMEQNKPRFLYNPPRDDGQSPRKVFDKGFVSFDSVSELEKLLESKFEEPEIPSDTPTTLEDFR